MPVSFDDNAYTENAMKAAEKICKEVSNLGSWPDPTAVTKYDIAHIIDLEFARDLTENKEKK